MESVSRDEFNLYLKQQNGTLQRIEDRLCRLEAKIDALSEADATRVTIEAYNAHIRRCEEEFEKLRYRLTPGMAALLAFLSSACSACIVLVLSKVI